MGVFCLSSVQRYNDSDNISIMSEKITKVAVNVFVVRDNKLLLGKRKNVVGDGFWCIPGGHLEYGESIVAGAERELKEETGLTANLSFFSVVNDYLQEEDTHYIHFQFLAENIVGEPKLEEPDKCYEWKWFALNKLPKDIFVGHKKVIPTILDKTVFVD